MILHLLPNDVAPPGPRQTVATATRARAPAAPAAEPPRGELHIGLGLQGGASGWSGDPVGYGALTIGVRLFRVITPFVGGATGYARIDQRIVTRISFGVILGVPIAERFYLRGQLAFVHQHEESLASVAQEPFGALLGIGPGIRHRAGGIFGVGFDFVLRRAANYVFTLGPDLSANYLTYSAGPHWYYLVGVTAAGHFRLF